MSAPCSRPAAALTAREYFSQCHLLPLPYEKLTCFELSFMAGVQQCYTINLPQMKKVQFSVQSGTWTDELRQAKPLKVRESEPRLIHWAPSNYVLLRRQQTFLKTNYLRRLWRVINRSKSFIGVLLRNPNEITNPERTNSFPFLANSYLSWTMLPAECIIKGMTYCCTPKPLLW